MSKILSKKEWLGWNDSFFWINHNSLLPDDIKDNNGYWMF